MRRDQISIKNENNVPAISGKKESVREETGAESDFREPSPGSFSRSICLPAKVAEDQIDASSGDSVLRSIMSRYEMPKTRKIEIHEE